MCEYGNVAIIWLVSLWTGDMSSLDISWFFFPTGGRLRSLDPVCGVGDVY